ncbi:MAG: NADH-quinone oxidoreductase subunit D [Chloroflexi bacterium]|nr:NADH-quinone oxidoreductase subunit D [Chloroflexota bacterium]
MTYKTEPVLLNLGPQHPSTHGVFRIRALLDGENVLDVEPIFGYLHRGSSKLAEERSYTQVITLTDRLDYVAGMSNNLAYVRAVEALAGVEVPERAQYLRAMMAELMRISSHLMALGFLLNDMGAWVTPLMYMFREREKVLDLFEMVCGARITFSYMRVGGVSHDLPPGFDAALYSFLDDFEGRVDEYERLLMENEIIIARLKGVAPISAERAINCSVTGPNLRASGVNWDLRKADPYEVYDRLEFDVPLGQNGDSWDRLWVRLQEMRQSARIARQCMERAPAGEVRTPVSFFLRPPPGDVYRAIEAPKGELGFYLVSDGTIAPWRCGIRSPSFINLTVLREICVGWKLADLIVNFGTLDINVGEVDR